MRYIASAMHADFAVVGAGVLGLAHAYQAARRGKSVVVFERNEKAMGASIRNFGMIWPVGQPAGAMHGMALRSREIWLEVLKQARIPYLPTGSIHAAYRPDEAEVAKEFAAIGPGLGYPCEFLPPDGILARSQAIVPEGLLGGLWSPTELTVDPRLTIATLPGFLTERFGVQFRFGSPVLSVAPPVVKTATASWEVGSAVICSGDDFQTLYPELFADSGLTRCKLQMLRTGPQPGGWQLGPSLAAGLTLRFYAAFEVCSGLPALKRRIAEETPEFDRWGIHVLVSQTALGELTLGDSHEYGREISVFSKDEIDQLILGYLRTFLRAPDLSIAERWHGVYAKHASKPFLRLQPHPNVRVVTAPGGSGMTLSFGLAEQTLKEMGL
jgi:FAD dependent oxidoreductase TIGR03364